MPRWFCHGRDKWAAIEMLSMLTCDRDLPRSCQIRTYRRDVRDGRRDPMVAVRTVAGVIWIGLAERASGRDTLQGRRVTPWTDGMQIFSLPLSAGRLSGRP